ncbi:MAG: acylglycerol kinase family protein [Patescibacteria group bacterium]
MYQYIYDGFLSDQKYDKILTSIESKLTDLDIKGRLHKLTIQRSFENYLKEIADKKSDCLVVVGNDNTLAKIINIVVEKNIVLGIIPIGNNNRLANFLGIPNEEKACEILAARRIEELDLGKINGQYFLSSIEVEGEGVSILCNNKYEIKTLLGIQKIGIYNLCLDQYVKNIFNPQDKKLEILSFSKNKKNIFSFRKKELRETLIKIKHAKIFSSGNTTSVIVDGSKIIKTPAEVSLAEKTLKIIVGKNRKF